MKAATGEYLNLYSEIGHEDETDLHDDKLDIFILFCETDSGSINMAEMEDRARKAIETYKQNGYVAKKDENDKSLRFIEHKVKRVLEEAFADVDTVLIVVNRIPD